MYVFILKKNPGLDIIIDKKIKFIRATSSVDVFFVCWTLKAQDNPADLEQLSCLASRQDLVYRTRYQRQMRGMQVLHGDLVSMAHFIFKNLFFYSFKFEDFFFCRHNFKFNPAQYLIIIGDYIDTPLPHLYIFFKGISPITASPATG